MKLLVVDGNSILNRAYYGIRLLSTKDGKYTNGIYGFMNIFLSLLSNYEADAAAVAFDLKAPTFRHKMFADYKAGRKPMPPELREQFPALKELLRALGYCVVEKEGYEADDILGTLSHACGPEDVCYLATGDRDSLQLVRSNVKVLLASTKMGQSVTTVYDEAKIREEYHVSPEQMIDIKAIQGDSSDNIPGVAGIGPKGAVELIEKFGSLEGVYEALPEADIKEGMKQKLLASRDMAFLSKQLGTICLEAPVDTKLSAYRIQKPDEEEAKRILTSLELFKIMSRISFDSPAVPAGEPAKSIRVYEASATQLLSALEGAGKAYLTIGYCDGGADYALFRTAEGVAVLLNEDFTFYSTMRAVLQEKTIEKYTDDAKALYAFCRTQGIALSGVCLDTALAAYLLNPNASDYRVLTLAGVYGIKGVTLSGEECAEFSASHQPELEAAAVLESLSGKLSAAIAEAGQEKLLHDIEIPLAFVLADMERVGFSVDRAGIIAYGEKLGAELSEKSESIYRLAGGEFNINSPKQLAQVLFSEERLNLPHGKKTKSGYSTNADVLESLRDKHPVIPEILEYRSLSKLKSTYCDGLLKVIDNDGRIHSTLNQTETRTGRISSAEPNLQNIPVRTPRGREMRRFFNAKEGCVLVDADYSQIELRVLAAMAGDQHMIEAFRNGTDIHALTASQVFGVPLSEVTSTLRSRAKAVNFGIVYGIGAFSLSGDIGVSVQEADRYIKGYLANFSDVARFMEEAKRSAKEKGYAQTLFGRRRYLPELTASNANLRAFGERVAMNMPIQGTAADIIKIAMIRVHDRLAREFPDSKLILQVHDELLIEAPEADADAVCKLLSEEMQNAAALQVPLPVEVHAGKTWYDTK